jgi:hypothetical protein
MDWSALDFSSPTANLARVERHIRALPSHTPLTRDDVCRPQFRLHTETDLEVYYAPFDHVNEHARIALVGITPGWTQMEQSFRAVRDALRANLDLGEAAQRAKRTASFAGIRATLTEWLDEIDVAKVLGINSAGLLFGEHGEHQALLHATSVVRYPVFVRGGNYGGHRPRLLRHPVLRGFVDHVFATEIGRVREALVVPLGAAVEGALCSLIERGVLDGGRCLLGFPHPSRGKGFEERQARYLRSRDALTARVYAWAARSRR